MKNVFVHHVFFWLKKPDSSFEKRQLLAGLHELSKVSSIQHFHIGVPAATKRKVIDTTYSVSWMLIFENKEAHDSYQKDRIHLQFIKDCAHLWEKVLVYDSEDA